MDAREQHSRLLKGLLVLFLAILAAATSSIGIVEAYTLRFYAHVFCLTLFVVVTYIFSQPYDRHITLLPVLCVLLTITLDIQFDFSKYTPYSRQYMIVHCYYVLLTVGVHHKTLKAYYGEQKVAQDIKLETDISW